MNYNDLRTEILRRTSTHLDNDLGFNCITTSKLIRYVRMYDTDCPTVEMSVSVAKNFKLSVKVHGIDLPTHHEVWEIIPHVISTFEDIKIALESLSEYRTCVGNPDEKLINMDIVSDMKDQTMEVFREKDFGACVDDISYSETIRTCDCDLLVKENRCLSCEEFRQKVLNQEVDKSPRRRSTRKSKPSAKLRENDVQVEYMNKKRGRQKLNYTSDDAERDETKDGANEVKFNDGVDCKEEEWEDEEIAQPKKRKREFKGNTVQENNAEKQMRSCPYCSEKFSKRWMLEEHMLEHTTAVPKEGELDTRRKKKKSKLEKCTMCEFETTKHYLYVRHMLQHTKLKPYDCELCEKSFTTPGTLEQHMRTHTGDMRYQCQYEGCNAGFVRISGLKDHEISVHTKNYTFRCELCNKGFLRNAQLITHTKRCKLYGSSKTKTFKCDICEVVFLSNRERLLHVCQNNSNKIGADYEEAAFTETMKSVDDMPENATYCAVCCTAFMINEDQRKHVVEEHTQEYLFRCDKCDVEYSSESELREHSKLVHVDETKVTRKTPRWTSEYQDEKLTNGGKGLERKRKNTLDEATEEEIKVLIDLDGSMTSADGDEMADMEGSDDLPSNTQKLKFTCDTCGTRCKTEFNMEVHKLTHLADDNFKAFKCSFCNDFFTDSLAARQHQQKHLKNIKGIDCPLCENSFDRIDALVSHIVDVCTIYNKPDECPFCKESVEGLTKTKKKTHIESCAQEIQYVCKKCKEKCIDEQGLLTHVQLCCPLEGSEVALFKCPLCDARFKKQVSLNSHIARMHTTDKPYKCVECDASFTKAGELEHHNSLHTGFKKFMCDQCESSFRTAQSLRRHKEAHHPLPGQEAPCTICGEVFDTQAQLWEHGFKHKGYPFNCDVCKTGYSRKAQYERHNLGRRHANKAKELGVKLPENDGKFRHVCEMCGKKFYLSYDCKRHKEMVHGEKNFQCLECPKKFVTENKLKQHMDAHVISIQYVCSECGKGCTSLPKLKKHEQIHREKKHPCPKDHCEKVFARPSQLEAHLKSHDGKNGFRCDRCNKSFGQKLLLDKHNCSMRKGPEPRKKWLNYQNQNNYCSLCFLLFDSDEELKEHTDSNHKTDLDEWCCKECGIVCDSIGTLKKHLNTVHKRMAPVRYECDVCGKTFDTKAGRDLHEANHTDVRDVPCTVCSRMFVSERHMKRHFSDHHKERLCKICNKTFENKYAFTVHKQKDHEAVLPVECKFCRKTFISEEYLTHHIQQASEGKTQCNYCYVCNVKTNTIKHWEAVHQTGKLFKCDLCHRRFCSEDDKLFHMSSRHMGGKFVCTACNITFRNSGSLSNHRKRKHPNQTVTIVRGNSAQHITNQNPADASYQLADNMMDTQGQSTVKLISIGGQLYMQPTQPGLSASGQNENPTLLVQLDSNDETFSSTPNFTVTDEQNQNQQIQPSNQTSNQETVFTTDTAGNISYQIEDAVMDAQNENNAEQSGHVVVVQDEDSQSGQPRKIICYIDGDLPSNVTDDMTFIQQIIDKTGMVNADINIEESAKIPDVQQGSDLEIQETDCAQVAPEINNQYTNVVYNVPGDDSKAGVESMNYE